VTASAPGTLGVVGAGTMGAGIAQLGCGAGIRTLLHDPVPEALERGVERVRVGLGKWAERGREVDQGLLEPAGSLEELAPCELVIEAAPERADLKRELFERLSGVCPEAVLATNTSSIPVTALASAAGRPENVVGMHFFNPAPLMPLVEVIAADQTGDRALALARATGEAMEKRVILARDGPGFLVNRCGRPFYTEALRLLQERVATHEQIDRICRLGGGFRMGPFELMDLVGIDVGLEVAKSFMELSFGEPRWRPNPIQARMVAAGRLGRKTGRGYYDYSREPYRPEDEAPPAPGGGAGRKVLVLGEGALPSALRERVTASGFQLTEQDAEILVDAAPWTSAPGAETPAAPTVIRLSAPWGPERWSNPGDIGFHLLPPLERVWLAELTRGPDASTTGVQGADRFFRALGFLPEWVGHAPGLVLGRIVCQLVNEAAFAIGEGVGSPQDVDAGLELGLSHPRGAVTWGEQIGLDHVFAVLEGLYNERHEERYRCAPMLRRCALLGIPLREAP
jgi:3-hydroxybutyryl-CoA dehydrogenase